MANLLWSSSDWARQQDYPSMQKTLSKEEEEAYESLEREVETFLVPMTLLKQAIHSSTDRVLLLYAVLP